MQIQKVTVQALFSSAHYVVPSFQRRYVWGRNRQWGPLWQDVTDKAAEVLEHGKGDGVLPHFLGALVLKQQDTGLGQPMKRMVVDGQQRLTTLQVMIIAIRDAFRCVSRETDEERGEQVRNTKRALEPMIVSPPPAEKDHRYMIRPFATRDFEVFKQLVAGEEVATDHVLTKCHDYFRSEAVKWLRADPDLVADRARTLAEVLVGRFEVVGLNLDSKEDEYEIFEALNARGTPLTEWEKSKNHLLSKSRHHTEIGHELFYQKYVDRFDMDEWWTSGRSDQFLRYWLIIRLNRRIKADRVYYEFCRVVRRAVKQEGGLVEMTKCFCRYADIYRTLTVRPKDEDRTVQGLFKYRMGVLNVGVFVPMMMKLYHTLGLDMNGGQASEERECFDRCTRALESFVVRRQVVGWVVVGYRDMAIELLKKIDNMHDAGDPLQVLCDGLESAKWDWPSDNDIRYSVRHRGAYPGVGQPRLRMILEAVEDYMTRQSMAAQVPCPRNLWIEHVMPQSWQKHWRLPENATEQDHDRRSHALTTLGNLTLTTAGLGIKIGRSAWECKREHLGKHAKLFLTTRLLDQYWDRWNESTIEERGQSLAEVICKVWPGAESLRAEFDLGGKKEAEGRD